MLAGMRRIALIAALLLVVAAPAHAAAPRSVDRGIVVKVRPSAIFLRALDGTRERIGVSPKTVITLDGRPAVLRDLRRGDVVIVVHAGHKPAVQIQAFTR